MRYIERYGTMKIEQQTTHIYSELTAQQKHKMLKNKLCEVPNNTKVNPKLKSYTKGTTTKPITQPITQQTKTKTTRDKLPQRADKARVPHPGIPFKKELIEDLIVEHKGNISRVADAIGSCRGAVRGFIDRYPDMQQLLKDARERIVDELEEHVFDRAMRTKDTTLQIFLLKTQGKSRGYDQNEAVNSAKDIATAAFDFIVNKSKEAQTVPTTVPLPQLSDVQRSTDGH